MIMLDDGIIVEPGPFPYLGDDSTRLGDTATNLIGVIDFGATALHGPAGYKLQPASARHSRGTIHARARHRAGR